MNTRVLIVEDDEVLRSGLAELLSGAGCDPVTAACFADAAELIDESFDLYLVDIMLGDGSGLELCRRIRQSHDSPIIFLTAIDDEDTVIEGLSAGADDYVTKPFRAGELLARVAANLRRRPQGGVIVSGSVRFSVADGRVFVSDEEIRLRRSEQTLLKLFLESGGRLLTRDYLLYAVWDAEGSEVEENTLSVLVSRLRKELGRYRGRDYIETVRGIGYRWSAPCTSEGGRNEQ